MLYFKFDEDKAISVALYITKKIKDLNNNRIKSDFHKIFKIIYFAEREHIARYGRPILGDNYMAMKDGPVPSRLYDIFKTVKRESLRYSEEFDHYFDVNGYFVYPKIEPDLDELSEAEIECLDKSFEDNHNLSFGELRDKSHDTAWNKATKDQKISFREMAKVEGANSELIAYMRSISENESLFL